MPKPYIKFIIKFARFSRVIFLTETIQSNVYLYSHCHYSEFQSKSYALCVHAARLFKGSLQYCARIYIQTRVSRTHTKAFVFCKINVTPNSSVRFDISEYLVVLIVSRCNTELFYQIIYRVLFMQ